MTDGGKERPGFGRREILGAAAALLAAELVPTGCARDDAAPLKPGQVAVRSGDLAGGRRVIVTVAGNPVEVFRNEDRVTARLLRCTHSGCVVRWNPQSRRYLCPCHDGRFDEDGRVVAGPPPGPLRLLPVSVGPDRVVIG